MSEHVKASKAKAAESYESTSAADVDVEIPSPTYRALKELGKGSFGSVSQVEHTKYGTAVVKTQQVRSKPELKHKLNEIDVLEYLNDLETPCPWVIKIYGHEYVRPNTLNIFMEHFQGYDLNHIAGTFDFTKDGYDRWDTLLCDLVEAVHCIHRMGVAHRDIKLANVMYDDKCLKLVDFGLSCYWKSREESESKQRICSKNAGTLFYFSPELWKRMPVQIPGLPVKPGMSRPFTWDELRAADIWALANVMYGVAYGNPIYARKELKLSNYALQMLILGGKTSEYIRSTKKSLGQYTDIVQDIIIKLTDQDPATRISNFEQIWERCSGRVMRLCGHTNFSYV